MENEQDDEVVSHLPPPDETLLRIAAARGDRAAQTALLKRNKGLMKVIVRERSRRLAKADWDDLWQEASIGLLLAVDHYRPDVHGPFSKYAASWMRGEVRHAVAKNRSVVRYSALPAGELRPSDCALDDELVESLSHEQDPETLLIESETKASEIARVRQAMAHLSDSERALIEAHWLAPRPVSLADFGRQRRVSQQRLKHVHRAVMRRLAKLLDRRHRIRSLRARKDRRRAPVSTAIRMFLPRPIDPAAPAR